MSEVNVQDAKNDSAWADSDSELSKKGSEDLKFMQQDIKEPSKTYGIPEKKRGPGRPPKKQGSSPVPYGYWVGVSPAEKRTLLADQARGISLPKKTLWSRKDTKKTTKNP